MHDTDPSYISRDDQPQFSITKKDVTVATAGYAVAANTAGWMLTGLRIAKILPGVSTLGVVFLFSSGIAAGVATVYNLVT
jgi:hypothetical protein